MADWMLDPPDDDDEPLDSDDEVDYDEPDYDADECAANASSDWENSRDFY